MSSRIEIDGIDKLVDGFDKLLKAVGPSVVLNVIGDRLLYWTDENFQKEGAEESWPKLSPNTIASRRKASSKPLQDTGNLKRSFKKEVFSSSVDVGTRNWLARIHHEGVPASKFAGKLIPRNKKALAFATAGGPVVVRAVKNHPGIPRRPLLPTQRLAEKLASKTAQAMLDKVIAQEF